MEIQNSARNKFKANCLKLQEFIRDELEKKLADLTIQNKESAMKIKNPKQITNEIFDAERLANDVKAGYNDLQEFIKTKLMPKVGDLMILQDSGIAVEEELMDVKFEGLRLHNDQQEPLTTFSNLLTKVSNLFVNPIDADRPLLLTEEKIKANKKLAKDLHQCLIEVELDCLKYNLPMLDQIKDLEEYEIKMQNYMRTWKDEAKMYRKKGYKTFKELLQQIDQSSEEGRITFEEVKHIVMDTGADLTRILVDFLFLGQPTTEKFAKRLELVRTGLGCLGVEANSIFMDIVLDILEVAEREAMEEKLIIPSSSDEENGSLCIIRKEANIFRKILREFARFEICFCCPSLPFMYSNDVLRSMGEIFKRHSLEKMSLISYNIAELKIVEMVNKEDECVKTSKFKIILSTTHIDAKWWCIDLKPKALSETNKFQ